MTYFTDPQTYNICFSVASIIVLIATLGIHLSEVQYYGKQSSIFGMLIFNGLAMNFAGLSNDIWILSPVYREFVTYGANCVILIIERICIYLMAYLSLRYVMALFHIEPDGFLRKAILILPTVYSFACIASGLFTDFYFSFTPDGKIKYSYPAAGTINIGVWLYFIFAAYIVVRYIRTISSEKKVALIIYYFLMLGGIPIRILTRSSSIFEFSVSIALLLCVYTFQNPSEFIDKLSGAGTKKALDFSISTYLVQKKAFTVMGFFVERLSVIVGAEPTDASSGLLTQITDYLKELIPEGEVFYPDEGYYALILPDTYVEEDTIERIAEQIRKRFKEPWNLKDKEIHLSESPCAIGFPEEVDSLERFDDIRDVMKKALLRRNREILRTADLNLKYVEHDRKIDNIVKHALEDGLLEVYYQPIYSPKTGKYISCEALVRLKDLKLGFISPAVFMPIAERNGAVLAIDRFVMSKVCEMMATTEASELGLEYVEVNLSIVDCIQTNMADNMLKIINKYAVDTSMINIEITETWEKGITSVVDQNIKKLMSAGVNFSMDDFGTGYSNIARIAFLPVRIFKLDKSIVQAAFDSETSYMVLFNLVRIIKSLKKEIVEEGVETAEQASQLIKFGVDHIQGFFYARPMPQKQFIEFLKEHNK